MAYGFHSFLPAGTPLTPDLSDNWKQTQGGLQQAFQLAQEQFERQRQEREMAEGLNALMKRGFLGAMSPNGQGAAPPPSEFIPQSAPAMVNEATNALAYLPPAGKLGNDMVPSTPPAIGKGKMVTSRKGEGVAPPSFMEEMTVTAPKPVAKAPQPPPMPKDLTPAEAKLYMKLFPQMAQIKSAEEAGDRRVQVEKAKGEQRSAELSARLAQQTWTELKKDEREILKHNHRMSEIARRGAHSKSDRDFLDNHLNRIRIARGKAEASLSSLTVGLVGNSPAANQIRATLERLQNQEAEAEAKLDQAVESTLNKMGRR